MGPPNSSSSWVIVSPFSFVNASKDSRNAGVRAPRDRCGKALSVGGVDKKKGERGVIWFVLFKADVINRSSSL